MAAHEAAQVLARKRWGPQHVIKIAAELERRAHELPASERQRLIEALQQTRDG